jgi:hypothetical protein
MDPPHVITEYVKGFESLLMVSLFILKWHKENRNYNIIIKKVEKWKIKEMKSLLVLYSYHHNNTEK